MHNKPHTAEARRKMSEARTGRPNLSRRRPTIEVDSVVHYRCAKCCQFLPFEMFYKTKRTLLGIKSECRACHIETSIASRDKDRHRENRKLYARKARERDPEKVRRIEREASLARTKDHRTSARNSLNAAIRSGALVRPDVCEECGNTGKIHGHHHDYAKPLDVNWLCPECHGKRHRKVDVSIEGSSV